MKVQPLNKIIVLLLFLPVSFFGQSSGHTEKDITGLWKGALYNDTTAKYLPYEIAISEEKGKLTGYSYTLFDIDGKKELGVKRIKIIRKDNELTIEDVELISNTYSEPPPRKVRQHSVVNLSVNDTSMQLTGKWNTNPTREYRPLTGTMQLQRSRDYKPEVLFKKLVELRLDQDLSFVKPPLRSDPDEAIEKPIAKDKAPEAAGPPAVVVNPLTAMIVNPETRKNEMPVRHLATNHQIKTPAGLAKKMVAPPPAYDSSELVSDLPKRVINNLSALVVIKSPGRMKQAVMISSRTAKRTGELAISKLRPPVDLVKKALDAPKTAVPTPNKKPQPVVAVREPARPGASAVAVVKNPVTEPRATPPPAVPKGAIVIAEKKKDSLAPAPVPAGKIAAADVAERKMKNEQSVYFESDSLVLTLYDNGEVDGDTVSVLMNGQMIFAKQGLTTKANSKTIYIDQTMPDTISMVMYAENLGSIPPNTGLLIIMDGEKRYEVRFSADLQTNAAILFRRKPKVK